MRNATMLTSRQFLDRLRLRPWGHPKAQYLGQRPHMVGQTGRHRRGTRLPDLGRSRPVGGQRRGERLAQTGMGQHKVMIHLEERQLVT